MSEGVTKRAFARPPRGVKVRNDPKYYTRSGVKYMFIAILIGIISYLFSIAFFFLLYNISLTNYTNMIGIFYSSPLSYLTFLFLKLIFIILIFISLRKFSKESTKISQKHVINLYWAKGLFLSYIPLLVIVFYYHRLMQSILTILAC